MERPEKPAYIYERDFSELLNVEKYFPDLEDVSSLMTPNWALKSSEHSIIYKFVFENPKIHTKDYEEAKIILEPFLKEYVVSYRTLMEVSDFALLDILKYDYGFTLYDVVVSFFDAEYFLRRFFDPKIKLAAKQREMLRAGSYEDFVSIKSSTASGKSFINARLGFWWMSNRKNSKLVMTAPTSRQAINILWSEFKQVYYVFQEKYPLYVKEMMTGEPKTISFYQGIWNVQDKEEQWQALCFSVKDYKPESIQGFHSKWMMVIVDEASGVDDALFMAVDRILTGSQVSKYYLISNPTRTTGYFYDTQLPDSVFKKVHISAFDSPNTILEFLEKKMYNTFFHKKRRLIMKEQPYKLLNNFYKDKGEKSTIPSLQYIAGLMTIKDVVKYMKMYGRDSDKFRMDILGEFPKYSGEYLASREDIDACKQITPNIIGNDAQFGIDVATGNAEAKTAFAYRNGNSLLNAIVSDAHSPDQIIQDFKKFATECSLPKLDLKKIPIVVDRDGIGYALFERMKDNGFNIDGFHGNQTPIDFHNQERFANRRTEAFFELADKIRTHTAFLINHLALYVLQSISYGVDRGGKIILQPKKEIIIPSKELYLLDVIDAISYAFAPTHKKGSVLGYGKRFVDDTLKFWRGY